MLTIFSVPKAFKGKIGVIQRNAIHSWSRLCPTCEIILCGDECGTREAADEYKLGYIPNIACNDYNTPLVNSVFDQVKQMASKSLMCYVNADIILLSDFLEAVYRIRFRRFLMVGQRWDVNFLGPWNFEEQDWEERLRRYVTDYGILHPPAGSDYFVFPRDIDMGKLPPFVVGRAGWDNWFIWKARSIGIPVVDVTKVVTVVHQNHSYDHVCGRKDETWEGPETERNRELVGGWEYVFTLLDATHLMTSRGVLPAMGYRYLKRRWQTLPILVPGTRPILRILEKIGDHLGFLQRSISLK